MKVIFWDKERERYYPVPGVTQLQTGKAEFDCRIVNCWICHLFDGKIENYGQRRFIIERIEQ